MENKIFETYWTRVAAFIIDMFIVTALLIPCFCLVYFCGLDWAPIQWLEEHYLLDALIMVGLPLLFLCFKDITGRSVGKRILKLNIIAVKNQKKAGFFLCVIRNVFMLIWPVEFLIGVIKDGRKLGDLIAGTEVISTK